MKADMTDEKRAEVAKLIVAVASQMAPGCEGEALHSAVMYWLDEVVISEDDPDIAKVNEGLGRLSGKMQALCGVPGRSLTALAQAGPKWRNLAPQWRRPAGPVWMGGRR